MRENHDRKVRVGGRVYERYCAAETAAMKLAT